MCNFLSGITLENGEVLISKKTDSHHEILSEFKISDKEIPPNFCAWEFTPPIQNERYDYSEPTDKWNFNVDEQFPKPEWWNAGIEKLTIDECKKRIEEFIIKTDIEIIESGRWIIISGTIQYVMGNATIKDVRGNATIQYVMGNATIQYVMGNATIKDVRDNATIHNVRDNATIHNVRGNATIQYVMGNATIHNVRGNAIAIDNKKSIRIIITSKNRFEDK